MSEPFDENDRLRAVLEALPPNRRRLRDALDGVRAQNLHYRDRDVGMWGKVNDILGIDWDDPQRVVRLIDEMDASDG